LLEDPTGFSATVVTKAGWEPAQLRGAVLEGLRSSPEGEATTTAELSRFAERALEAAAAEAARAGRPQPEERDLLVALIAHPKGRLAQVLKGKGKSLEVLRSALGGGQPAAPSAQQPRRERQPKASTGDRSPASPPRPAQPAAVAPAPEVAKAAPRRIAQPDPPKPFPWRLLLFLAIPATIALSQFGAPPVATFIAACLGVLPLAGLMGEATESLADRTGPTVGGLLIATFGNAAELIIAVVALRAGLVDLVKGSVTGSILANLLLILGLSFVAGGARGEVVRFNRANAGMSSAMLALAVIGLVFPTLFHAIHGPPNAAAELYLSEVVAGILIATYGLSLLFSLKTHRALFGGGDHPAVIPKWGVGASIGLLAAATVGIVIQSEILVHVVEEVTKSLGLTETFLGLIIVPLIGNAAEHATAIVVARKGQMDLALQIALGSSTQVALLIAPVLVFIGLLLGSRMDLVFPVFEVAALSVSTIVIAIITLDGETHWFEGAQLLAVYGMIAAAAFFI
jgi:Ca2+:H+ antiporter